MMVKNNRIAIIHPDYKNKVNETLSAPLGLCWISAVLKKNSDFQVECFDFAKDSLIASDFHAEYYSIFCVQLHSQETLEENLKFISDIKRQNSSSIIIVGGIASDLNTQYVISKDYIDIVSIGEGEQTIFELCLALFNKRDISNIRSIAYKNIAGEIIFTKKRKVNYELDKLPMPDREGFGVNYPQWSIITSRGCPFNCNFCTMPQIYNHKVRYRSITNVYNEICQLYDNYGMQKFFILDDTFTADKKRVLSLCRLMKQGNRNFEWTCLTRADSVDKSTLIAMKEAGCIQISCGIESANNDIQTLINKNLDIDKALDNLKVAQEIGLRIRCSFIFGLPGERVIHIEKSIQFMCNLKPNEIQIYPFVPYNGLSICQDQNSSQIEWTNFEFWDKKDLFSPYMETNLLPRDEILKLSHYCIDELKKLGYLWIPGDLSIGKHQQDYVVMTQFAPVQTLC